MTHRRLTPCDHTGQELGVKAVEDQPLSHGDIPLGRPHATHPDPGLVLYPGPTPNLDIHHAPTDTSIDLFLDTPNLRHTTTHLRPCMPHAQRGGNAPVMNLGSTNDSTETHTTVHHAQVGTPHIISPLTRTTIVNHQKPTLHPQTVTPIQTPQTTLPTNQLPPTALQPPLKQTELHFLE